MLKGKRLSILGDSISTYEGYSNDENANKSTAYNKVFYKSPFPPQKTYWMKLIKDFELTLCVNNSWSGGNLSGKNDETSGLNRAVNLADNNGNSPDIVIVFMGINDLGRNIPLETFCNDYEATLKVLKKYYPKSIVCCVNIPDRDVYLKNRAILFNDAIEKSVKLMGNGFFVADLFGSKFKNDFYYNNTLDGLHPDEDGMMIIAEVIEEAIKNNI